MVRSNDNVQRVTIIDVAKAAGVSKTTVSRFLSGEYESIAQETSKKIEAAIQSLNYHPNRMASGLKGRKSHLIGLIVADITNPFSTAILRGAEDICHQYDYSLLVCNSDNNPDKERNYILMLQSHQIDGLVIQTTGQNQSLLLELQKDNTPIVFLDREVSGMNVDLVTVDNRQATYDALDYLLSLGYRDIGYFTQPIADVSTRTERVRAFKTYMAYMAEQEVNVKSSVYEIDVGNRGLVTADVKSFTNLEATRHKAIFAGNSVMLLKLGIELQRLGYHIGKDIALIGFDDPEWAQMMGISTIAQPTYSMGVKALELLLGRIRGDIGEARIIRVPGALIGRESTPLVTGLDWNK